MITRIRICLVLLICGTSNLRAQDFRWQQAIDYVMDIDFDVDRHQFSGTQTIKYTNNSPDTLHQVFYHLYFNAFQPNSMMDIRSQNLRDPDPRVADRIAGLGADEIGYLKVKSLQHNGTGIEFETAGTILEVPLATPILPGETHTFAMTFDGQVPVQIRRSGRDNKEKISYTMTQWYPKLCEYDYEGWHSNPYIAREFHGVWGDFDVTLHIDKNYVVAATGLIQNPEEVGHGYASVGSNTTSATGDKITWKFKAENVHDFAWAADKEYVHDIAEGPNGMKIHFFYQPDNDTIKQNWENLQPSTVRLFEIMNTTFGEYPYSTYSVIQGGDGGMEYSMCTMITGKRPFGSLLGVTVHEVIHSWFQHSLATNEALYAWMDEGFTSFATSFVMDKLYERNQMNPHLGSYRGYFSIVKAGFEEPSTTHSDHFQTNYAYSISAYSKGAVFCHQLSYIIGREAFFKGMKRYYNTWKFRHPEPRDFKRIMEKESGLELDWYFEHWIRTTNFIDYGIKAVGKKGNKTEITLERKGSMPMPIDLLVRYQDGSSEMLNIPLQIMRGNKEDGFFADVETTVLKDWQWTHPNYTFILDQKLKNIQSIVIDPSLRMADVDTSNNTYEE